MLGNSKKVSVLTGRQQAVEKKCCRSSHCPNVKE
jgi:hypothetical protein